MIGLHRAEHNAEEIKLIFIRQAKYIERFFNLMCFTRIQSPYCDLLL